jgi:hypothetical protein
VYCVIVTLNAVKRLDNAMLYASRATELRIPLPARWVADSRRKHFYLPGYREHVTLNAVKRLNNARHTMLQL